MTLRKLAITLFGSLGIVDEDGSVISLPTRKSEALLAYLLVRESESVSRKALSDLLWPYSGPDQARASLRQEISVLRKALGPTSATAVVTTGDRVGFAPSAVDVDLWQFKRGTQSGDLTPSNVLALYRGPFLDTFRIGSQPFSDWIWNTRQTHEAAAIRYGAAALQGVIAQEDHEQTHDIAQHLCRIDPSYEPAHRALIRFYMAKGDVHLARRQVALCQSILKSQRDADLSVETQTLVAQIDAQKPANATSRNVSGQPFQQRRFVTVLSVLAQLDFADPEDFDAAAREFVQLVAQIVTAKGGTVLQVFNDRVSVVFGYPVTYDGDANSAILAAFDLLDTVQTGQWIPATCQIGVAQGVALITTHDGPEGTRFDITGPVVRDAETCAQTARHGQVWVGAATQIMASPQIEFLASGDRTGPKRAIRPAMIHDRQDQIAMFAARSHATIGQDMAKTHARTGLERALSGQGAAIAILGNPGEGKSRLVQDVAEIARQEDFEINLFQGARFASQSTFEPVIDHIRRMHDFEPNNHPDSNTPLVGWLAKTTPALAPAARYFASLLGGPVAVQDETGLSMSQAKDLALNYFAELAKQATPQAPRLLIFEDMHWFDPTSCDAVARLIDALQKTSTCALFVARSDEIPAVLNHPLVQHISLNPLSPADAETLLRKLVKSTFLSKATVANVLARAEGNPLIIEEFAKVLDLRESASSAPVGTVLDMARPEDAVHDIALPELLLPLLLARIDSVPGAIQVLQNAAVLGRSFTAAHLASIMQPTALPRLLFEELEAAGILFTEKHASDRSYYFKHALISEAIYSTIPIRNRKTLHAAAARALLAGSSKNDASEIARHYKAAEAHSDAATYFERAGDKAVRVTASAEAIFEFSQALEMIRHTPPSETRMRSELSLNRKIAAQFIGLHGIPTSAAQPYYAAAKTLSHMLGDEDEIINVTWGLWSNHLMIAQLDACLKTAQKAHDGLGADAPAVTRLIVAYMLGVTHAYRGTLDEATLQLQTVAALFTDDMTHDLQFRFGMDISLTADSFLGWVHALNGQSALADATSQRALTRAGSDTSSLSTVFAHVFAATKCLFLDQIDAAHTHAGQALIGAQKMQFKQWEAQARIQLARVADLRGEPDALLTLQDATANYLETGMVLGRPYAQVWIAEAMIRRNQNAAALVVLDDLQTFTQASHERFFNRQADQVRALAKGNCQKKVT